MDTLWIQYGFLVDHFVINFTFVFLSSCTNTLCYNIALTYTNRQPDNDILHQMHYSSHIFKVNGNGHIINTWTMVMIWNLYLNCMMWWTNNINTDVWVETIEQRSLHHSVVKKSLMQRILSDNEILFNCYIFRTSSLQIDPTLLNDWECVVHCVFPRFSLCARWWILTTRLSEMIDSSTLKVRIGIGRILKSIIAIPNVSVASISHRVRFRKIFKVNH